MHRCTLFVSRISILAPTRGATFHFSTSFFAFWHFNPRSHEGSDANGCRRLSYYRTFQSSLPRGERLTHTFIYVKILIFQSSLPRGERPLLTWKLQQLSAYFNPRSHEGSDARKSIATCVNSISILAPTRGATNGDFLSFPQNKDFNPRSHEGSDSNFRQKVLFSLSKNCLKYLILTTNYFN